MTPHSEHELLSAYADGELDAAERRSVDSHLAGCAEARTILDAIRGTLADMALLDEPAMDPQAGFAIRSALARERKLSSRGRRYAWVSGAAAAAIVAVFSVAVLNGDDAGRSTGGAAADASRPQLLAEGNLDESSVGGVLRAYLSERFGAGASAAEDSSAAVTAGGSGEQVQTSALTGPNTKAYRAGSREDRTFGECIRAIERESDSVRLVRSLAGTYKDEPVYILLFEVPATDPERVEMWVTTRDTCAVRYFTQADVPQ